MVFLILFFAVAVTGNSQYNWKLSKNKDGIKVYQSETSYSDFKSIRVETVLPGNYDKLMASLNDVVHQKDWVYSSKQSYVLKRNSPYDFYYYTETSVPWPVSNRDAVIHMIMTRDSLDRFLKITATGVPDYIPEKNGKMRIPKLLINWYVTMLSSNSISIVYTFEAEPGGSVPAWLVNIFADKGPYESFKKLSEILKK